MTVAPKFFDFGFDVFKDAFDVSINISIGKSKKHNAVTFYLLLPRFVTPGGFFALVTWAVEFDG